MRLRKRMPDQRSLLLLFVLLLLLLVVLMLVLALDCCASSLIWLEIVIELALEWELLKAVNMLLEAKLRREDRVDWHHCCNVLVRDGTKKR